MDLQTSLIVFLTQKDASSGQNNTHIDAASRQHFHKDSLIFLLTDHEIHHANTFLFW